MVEVLAASGLILSLHLGPFSSIECLCGNGFIAFLVPFSADCGKKGLLQDPQVQRIICCKHRVEDPRSQGCAGAGGRCNRLYWQVCGPCQTLWAIGLYCIHSFVLFVHLTLPICRTELQVKELISRGYNVVAFSREKSGVKGKADMEATIRDFPGADVRFGEVTDMESLRTVGFKDKVDVVVSCLASRTGGKVMVDPLHDNRHHVVVDFSLESI